jgi:hypothetical protein
MREAGAGGRWAMIRWGGALNENVPPERVVLRQQP